MRFLYRVAVHDGINISKDIAAALGSSTKTGFVEAVLLLPDQIESTISAFFLLFELGMH
jgi:hypothetical protein